MPVGSTIKTRWEDGVRTFYLLDPDTGEPVGSAAAAFAVDLKDWHYIGSEVIVANGQQQATIQGGATAFVLEARGGAVHYAVNGAGCTQNDSYCPEDGMRSVGVVSNLSSLWVWGSGATVYAHLQYWRKA